MAIAIVIKTDLGNIEAELYPEKAPVTVANFLANVACGLYKDGSFFRSASADQTLNGKTGINIIEATKAEWKQGRVPIVHESTSQSGLLNRHGVLAMSRSEPGTAAYEFFINIGHNQGLDFQEASEESDAKPGYATFGLVTQGMEVVETICRQPRGKRALSEKEAELMSHLENTDSTVADWISSQLLNQNVRIHTIEIT